MSDASKARGKVELRIGDMSFSGEGDLDWLDSQITKLLEAASLGLTAVAAETASNGPEVPSAGQSAPMSLPSYIVAKGGNTIQVKRFLATAAWLHQRGTTQLTTALVARTLRENHQKKLGNPSDCLNKNVSKGFCEKTPDGGFFITMDGWNSLGEQA